MLYSQIKTDAAEFYKSATGCSTCPDPAVERERRVENSRLLSYRENCSDYGYTVGTPDFKHCRISERRAFEQMEYAASRRETDEIKRERRRRDDEFVRAHFGIPAY